MQPRLGQRVEYELCFGNPFYIKNNNGYNIKSSGFNVFGIADTVYMSDKPNANRRTGKIFLFKLQSKSGPVILSNNVGTIDYQKGEIMLDAINVTGTSKKVQDVPIIEVSACPESNDVIGLQDLYLQLDSSNSTVDMVSDVISSGANTAGNLYTATSSYISGDIARLTETESLNTNLTQSDTYILGTTTNPSSSTY